MKNQLNSSIAQIIFEATQFGYCPDVKQIICSANRQPFYLLTRPNTSIQKAALIGIMLDYYNKPVLKAYTIDFSRWNWASSEGFSLKDIFNADNLCDDIFTETDPYKISEYLV